MPAARRADSRAVSRPGARPRQMVHGRHPLPRADPEGRRDGRRQPARRPAIRAKSYANERTREVNRQQAERTRIQFTSIEKRLADMDRMGIDIQAISPSPDQTYYGADRPISASPPRASSTTTSPISAASTPTVSSPLGTVPFQAPELAVAELDRLHKSLGLPRHRDRHQRWRRGSVGAAIPPDLRPHRGIGPARLHAPDRLSRGAALWRSLPGQRDRQPARYDGRGASPDLWRGARRPPQSEARAVAWRRLSAGLFGPHRPRRLGPARLPASRSTRCRPTI